MTAAFLPPTRSKGNMASIACQGDLYYARPSKLSTHMSLIERPSVLQGKPDHLTTVQDFSVILLHSDASATKACTKQIMRPCTSLILAIALTANRQNAPPGSCHAAQAGT